MPFSCTPKLYVCGRPIRRDKRTRRDISFGVFYQSSCLCDVSYGNHKSVTTWFLEIILYLRVGVFNKSSIWDDIYQTFIPQQSKLDL